MLDAGDVVVPLTQGRLLAPDKSGERHAELAIGGAYARQVGVEHNVINANRFPFRLIEMLPGFSLRARYESWKTASRLARIAGTTMRMSSPKAISSIAPEIGRVANTV